MQASQFQSSLVSLKGKQFVAGQIWYDGHTDTSLSALIKETIGDVQTDAELVVKRPGVGLMGGGQFGLSIKGSNGRAWLPSLAATAASGPSSNWLAAIKLDDGRWWVGAAHERAILHDGDSVFASESEANRRFRELREVPDATREVFCPNSWDIPEASEEGYELISRGDAVAATLVPLSGTGALPGVASAMRGKTALAAFFDQNGKKGKKGKEAPEKSKDEINWPVVIGACAVILAGGGWFAKPYIVKMFGPPKAKVQQHKPIQEVWTAPWLASPQIGRAVFHCQQMREELSSKLMIDGWSWANGTCSPEGSKTDEKGNLGETIGFTVLGRQDTTGLWSELSDDVRVFRGEDPVTLGTTSDPKVAALIARRGVSARQQTPENSALWSHDEAIAYLNDIASVYGWAITWGAETKPSSRTDSGIGQNAHDSGFVVVTFISDTGFLPEDFPQVAPGLVLTSYDMASDVAAETFKETITIKAYYRG